MKKIILGVIVVAIIAIIITSNIDNKTNYKIGVIGPMTGSFASFGEEGKKGIESLDTSGIDFVYEDDACDATKAVTAFRKLTNIDQVKFIIGPGCGAPQEAIAPILKDKDIVELLPSAASNTLYETSGGKMFNAQYSLEAESKFLADKIYEKGYKNVVLITYQNAFSKVHRDTFVENFKGNIVKEISFIDPSMDVSTELSKLKRLSFDAIFSTDLTFFLNNGMNKLKRYGIDDPVYTQYTAGLPAVRDFVEGVIYSYPSDVDQNQGIAYNMARYSAQILSSAIKECDGVVYCVKEKISQDGFVNGVRERKLILKKIEGGRVVSL